LKGKPNVEPLALRRLHHHAPLAVRKFNGALHVSFIILIDMYAALMPQYLIQAFLRAQLLRGISLRGEQEVWP
jgi:hypothetical protein